jgi:hypothetical protein
MKILIVILVAILAVYAARCAWLKKREEEETRRLIKKLYGGDGI